MRVTVKLWQASCVKFLVSQIYGALRIHISISFEWTSLDLQTEALPGYMEEFQEEIERLGCIRGMFGRICHDL